MPVVVPEAPPPLLPGRSSVEWMRRFLKACVVGVPAVLLMPVASGLPEPLRDTVLVVLGVCGIAASAVGINAGFQNGRMEIAERDAGYTTQYGKRFELWQLEPRTGEVLRRPGERTARAKSR